MKYFPQVFTISLALVALAKSQQTTCSQQDNDCNCVESFTGPWYLLYWNSPPQFSIYTPDLNCTSVYGTHIEDDTIAFKGTESYQNGSTIDTAYSITKQSSSCGFLVQKGGAEIPVEVVDFNKYSHAIVSIKHEDETYLFAYGRDPRIASSSCFASLLEDWIKKTQNEERTPIYKDPSQCACE